MSNLLICAAPFEPDDSDKNNARNQRRKKRIQKKQGIDSKRLNETMEATLNAHKNANDDDEFLSDFNPVPPPAISQNIESASMKENFTMNSDSDVEYEEDEKEMEPNMYHDVYTQNQPVSFKTTTSSQPSTDLNDKLNYVIKMLEESHDSKTDNVAEEMILYSFLGIFVIFLVDSFAKVGKYTR